VEKIHGSAVSGVLVGRGALRNPWIFRQAADLLAGRTPRAVTDADRAAFLLAYIEMLQQERLHEAAGFRHVAPGQESAPPPAGPARGHDRWVINKLRALNSWFTKGLDNGSHLRIAVNKAESIAQLKDVISEFFTPATVR
jgi:tRNA-dihydrouridine synthase